MDGGRLTMGMDGGRLTIDHAAASFAYSPGWMMQRPASCGARGTQPIHVIPTAAPRCLCRTTARVRRVEEDLDLQRDTSG